MKLGIVGLPNVGKSTLFNSMTTGKAEAANYPFCTIDPNVGVVTVPDERLDVLGKMYNTQKITPAVLKFVDIAGLVTALTEIPTEFDMLHMLRDTKVSIELGTTAAGPCIVFWGLDANTPADRAAASAK